MPVSSAVQNLEWCRLRVPSAWNVRAKSDDYITLEHSTEPGGELSLSPVYAASEKVFTSPDGTRLWDAPEVLLHLAKKTGEIAGWSQAFDCESYQKKLTWGAASFREDGMFHRVWHIAGDHAIAVAIYECLWALREEGSLTSLPIVQSFRWTIFADE